MPRLLLTLQSDFPKLKFVNGPAFSWSPSSRTITYKTVRPTKLANWSMLHELAHATLGHQHYQTDFELLLMEVEAWDKAKSLAESYGLAIDEDHIQDCIDTYRDWLYQRSACPTCTNTSLQHDSVTYKCFNCDTVWTVTASRFCRPYRLTAKQQKTPPQSPQTGSETTFLHKV